jgi:hypothetical protein
VAASVQNLRHLEWFDDHQRIESLFFDGALVPKGGSVSVLSDGPGNGFTLRESDANQYRVSA